MSYLPCTLHITLTPTTHTLTIHPFFLHFPKNFNPHPPCRPIYLAMPNDWMDLCMYVEPHTYLWDYREHNEVHSNCQVPCGSCEAIHYSMPVVAHQQLKQNHCDIYMEQSVSDYTACRAKMCVCVCVTVCSVCQSVCLSVCLDMSFGIALYQNCWKYCQNCWANSTSQFLWHRIPQLRSTHLSWDSNRHRKIA